jgi:hypothetical protein
VVDISSQSERERNETVSLSKNIVNEKDDVKTGNEQKQSTRRLSRCYKNVVRKRSEGR